VAYGHPFLTNDRKPEKSFDRELRERWPDARVAWDNERGRWVILYKTRGGVEEWAIVLVVENKDKTFRDLDRRTILRLDEMDTDKHGTEVIEKVIREREVARLARKEQSKTFRREEAAPRLAHALYRDLNIQPHSVVTAVNGTKEW